MPSSMVDVYIQVDRKNNRGQNSVQETKVKKGLVKINVVAPKIKYITYYLFVVGI